MVQAKGFYKTECEVNDFLPDIPTTFNWILDASVMKFILSSERRSLEHQSLSVARREFFLGEICFIKTNHQK